MAYLRGLADELDRDEQAVFERSRVTEVGADGLTPLPVPDFDASG